MPPTIKSLPEPWQRRLYLPAYTVADAARYAKAPRQTVAYWHKGGRLGPALPGKKRAVPLSYMQLVEVAFVATFRDLGVPLQRIRKARDYLAQTFSSEYPFAEFRLQTEGYHVLLQMTEVEHDAEIERLIIADAAGQTAWKPMVGTRFAEFDYERGLAVIWHVAGRLSPIIIDPRISFGAPTVRGIPTWAIRGRRIAGETVEEITQDFRLDPEDVVQALAFEGIKEAA